jgi:hypothetical protein
VIIPSLDALKAGEAQTLSAVVVSGFRAQRTVSAAWSSDAPDMLA